MFKTEVSELQKSKRQMMDEMKHKEEEIVKLSENASQTEARLCEVEADLARAKDSCTRLSQEKELLERHNVWLNDELAAKVDSLIKLRREHADLEADLSFKLADVERKFSDCSTSLIRNKERVRELEAKLTALQEELCSSKNAAATNEERSNAEISTEAAGLKAKPEKCKGDTKSTRKANEFSLVPLNTSSKEMQLNSLESADVVDVNRGIVPKIPIGLSGTALEASLLRDGWSLAKMNVKYHETVDALHHEQLRRKASEAILQQAEFLESGNS